MNHKEKQSITHYISIRFAAIILIMAAIMILFISYFSNKTIYFDIRRQIRRESRYDFLNVEVRNGKILVDKNFQRYNMMIDVQFNDKMLKVFKEKYAQEKSKNHVAWEERKQTKSIRFYAEVGNNILLLSFLLYFITLLLASSWNLSFYKISYS